MVERLGAARRLAAAFKHLTRPAPPGSAPDLDPLPHPAPTRAWPGQATTEKACAAVKGNCTWTGGPPRPAGGGTASNKRRLSGAEAAHQEESACNHPSWLAVTQAADKVRRRDSARRGPAPAVGAANAGLDAPPSASRARRQPPPLPWHRPNRLLPLPLPAPPPGRRHARPGVQEGSQRVGQLHQRQGAARRGAARRGAARAPLRRANKRGSRGPGGGCAG
jgi:hypothetical protein